MKSKYLVIAGIVVFLASIVGAWYGGFRRGRAHSDTIEIVHTDTLTVHDTVHHEKPVYITRRVVDSILVPVPVRDTITERDSVYISLPREQAVYEDSLYRAWVSGYEPALDSIDIFTPTKYVTTTVREPKRHWHIGVSAGYGASLKEGGVTLTPYVGVGISYSIISW